MTIRCVVARKFFIFALYKLTFFSGSCVGVPVDSVARPAKRSIPRPGEKFKPRDVFGGIGSFIPEQISSTTSLSVGAKLCYGHLIRRANDKDHCWPSVKDIAKHVGINSRQAKRAIQELAEAGLIRVIPRYDPTGRQTSNLYEFIFVSILLREGDSFDPLPLAENDSGTVTHSTSPRVTNTTPLEVSKKNHHQENTKKENSAQQMLQDEPATDVTSQSTLREKSIDDDALKANLEYASPKDELKAIASAVGGPLRVADLDAIEALLIGASISWHDFLAEVRKHAWNKVKNPVGFLKSLAKEFRRKTQLASAPVTAAEAEEKNYRCPTCGSRERGAGAVLDANGKAAPCVCASPEYIVRQRERGVFSDEAAQG
jgi:hypothetical protein